MSVSRSLVRGLAAAAFLGLCLGPTTAARAEPPPLIPREVLFGNPEKLRARISPDGQRLAWTAPDKNDVLQVWVKTIGKDDEKIVTADKKRGIHNYQWAWNSRTLLIGQGANDPRVNKAESEQIVSAIEKHGGRVTYVLYADEGHGFARPENSIDFNARAEAFLASCLGGRSEPMEGEKHPGSTAIVKVVGGK